MTQFFNLFIIGIDYTSCLAVFLSAFQFQASCSQFCLLTGQKKNIQGIVLDRLRGRKPVI